MVKPERPHGVPGQLIGFRRRFLDPGRFRDVIRENGFEARSGRKPGEEDLKSHERKGVSGDWKNHFTDKIAKSFKARFASLLVATGYEKGFNW